MLANHAVNLGCTPDLCFIILQISLARAHLPCPGMLSLHGCRLQAAGAWAPQSSAVHVTSMSVHPVPAASATNAPRRVHRVFHARRPALL
jgi:hypothetical protein